MGCLRNDLKITGTQCSRAILLKSFYHNAFFEIALGYEDLNDHEQLRHDPLMAVLAGKTDPLPQEGFAVAGKSTLNRLELTPVGANKKSRYKKIVVRHRNIEDFFVNVFLQVHRKSTKRIVLDLDATDDARNRGQYCSVVTPLACSRRRPSKDVH